MALIQGIRIKNFKALKDVQLGRTWQTKKQPLKPLTVVIGKNGVGKSSLFDAFGFLADCLKHGVEEACDLNGRGGYHRILSQGANSPIEFELYYKEDVNSRPITYELTVDRDENGRPYVASERLRQRRKGQDRGQPFSFLILKKGKGLVWRGDEQGLQETNDWVDYETLLNQLRRQNEESRETEEVELDDMRRLGLATLGSLKQHPRISAFRRYIEGWYLSYFNPNSARSLPMAGPQKHLNAQGDNLGNVVQFMQRDHPERLKDILSRISEKIPGINNIDTEPTADGRLLLRFNNQGFRDPFYAQQMSDGTLKVFAYLLLLEDPSPPPFLCVEEPENGLYHQLLEVLAQQFRTHASGKHKGTQVFITTHQPYFVNALEPTEVWILDKGSDGFSTIRQASETELVNHLCNEGLPLGQLWSSHYLDQTYDAP
jgi:predicted ATPase